jgi:hypothetical protein
MTTSLTNNNVTFANNTTQSTSSKGGQVVSVTKTSLFTINVTSQWVDITDMALTITPTNANSKVLLMYSAFTSSENSTQGGVMQKGIRLLRNGLVIGIGDARGISIQCTTMGSLSFDGVGGTQHSTMYLDSPTTTDPVTYKLQYYCPATATACVGGTGLSSYQTYTIGLCAPTTLTAMEILP